MVYIFRSDAFCSTLSALYGKILVVMGWVSNFFTFKFVTAYLMAKTLVFSVLPFQWQKLYPLIFHQVSMKWVYMTLLNVINSFKSCIKVCYVMLFFVVWNQQTSIRKVTQKGKWLFFPPWTLFLLSRPSETPSS